MTDDIVARLRVLPARTHLSGRYERDCLDAADYIERQRASHDMMVEEIERLTRELKQEQKNSLRVSYERDEAMRDGIMEARRRGVAQDDRDDAILRAEAAERKIKKLRRIIGNAAAILGEK